MEEVVLRVEFDTRLFKNFIYFKTIMPYELKLSKNSYIFETDIKFSNELFEKKRRFRILSRDMMVKDQIIPPSNSNFAVFNPATQRYTYNVSSVDIQLEIFDEEVEFAKEYFHNKKNDIEILSGIFQNILLVFSQAYNEALAGTEFLKPVANHYGPFLTSFIFKENNEPKMYGTKMTVSYSLMKINKQKVFDIDDVKTECLMWRYYFNKAKNSYDLFDNLDTILSAAISLESYAVNLLKENNLEKEVEQIKSIKGNISFFDEIKLLEKNSVIDKQKAKKIKQCFSKLKDNRNMIVHGDLDSTIISRDYAEESINSLIELYENIANDSIN